MTMNPFAIFKKKYICDDDKNIHSWTVKMVIFFRFNDGAMIQNVQTRLERLKTQTTHSKGMRENSMYRNELKQLIGDEYRGDFLLDLEQWGRWSTSVKRAILVNE